MKSLVESILDDTETIIDDASLNIYDASKLNIIIEDLHDKMLELLTTDGGLKIEDFQEEPHLSGIDDNIKTYKAPIPKSVFHKAATIFNKCCKQNQGKVKGEMWCNKTNRHITLWYIPELPPLSEKLRVLLYRYVQSSAYGSKTMKLIKREY